MPDTCPFQTVLDNVIVCENSSSVNKNPSYSSKHRRDVSHNIVCDADNFPTFELPYARTSSLCGTSNVVGDITNMPGLCNDSANFQYAIGDALPLVPLESIDHQRSFSFYVDELGRRTYACSWCDYKTPRKDNLLVHVRRHTGVKPHSCTLCGKKFSDKSNFNAHVRRHSEMDNISSAL